MDANIERQEIEPEFKEEWRLARSALARLEEHLKQITSGRKAKVSILVQISPYTLVYDVQENPEVDERENITKKLQSGRMILEHCLRRLGHSDSLTVRQVKALLPEIRRQLNMGTYKWPEVVVKWLEVLGREGKPARPGDKNFKSKESLDALAICCICSAKWRSSIREAANTIPGGRLLADDTSAKPVRKTSVPVESSTRYKPSKKRIPEEELEERSIPKTPWIFRKLSKEWKTGVSPKSGTEPKCLTLPGSLVRVINSRSVQNFSTTEGWQTIQQLCRNVPKLPQVTSTAKFVLYNVLGDGSCLFYSVMLGACFLELKGSDALTCRELRTSCQNLITELSESGNIESRFRREWLKATLIHWEIIREQSEQWDSELSHAENIGMPEVYETASQGLREALRKHAYKIGRNEWGGSCYIDFTALCTTLGVAIEVWGEAGKDSPQDEVETFWNGGDPGKNGKELAACFRIKFLPEWLHLPSSDSCHSINLPDRRKGNRSLRVIRLFMSGDESGRHYQLCVPLLEENSKRTAEVEGRTILTAPLVAPFSSVTEDEENIIRFSLERAQQIHPEALVRIQNVPIGYKELETLYGKTLDGRYLKGAELWITDEIVSAYFELLKARCEMLRNSYETKESCSLKKVHFMTCHSSKKLLIYQAIKGAVHRFSSLDGEVQKSGMFKHDLILLPICDGLTQEGRTNSCKRGDHWVLASEYPAKKSVSIYDPYGTCRRDVGDIICSWASCCQGQDPRFWRVENLHHTEYKEGRFLSKQTNAVDCGLFICKAAEALSLSAPLSFRQEDMGHIRRRMLMELISERAVNLHETRQEFLLRGDYD